MLVRPLALPGLFLVVPKRHVDNRGHFVEVWTRKAFREAGIDCDFVQDNQSLNIRAGTLAGFHFQKPPSAQAKLVGALRGRLFDVAVDLRRGSPTFGRWAAAELSAANGEHLLIPRGCAHGYCTLEDNTLVSYKVDAYYDLDSEGGIRWDDPELAVDWPAIADPSSLSARDAALPGLQQAQSSFGMDL